MMFDAVLQCDTFAIGQAMIDAVAKAKTELIAAAIASGQDPETLSLCEDKRRRFWVESNDERVSDVWAYGLEWEEGAPNFFIRATHHGDGRCDDHACAACRRAALPKEQR
jgi:hypothetical protein